MTIINGWGETPLLDWEVPPWNVEVDENSPEYAIWRDGNIVHISSQDDCCESFALSTPQQVDELIERLKGARTWLIGKV